MGSKKKKEVDVSELDFGALLPETVASSRLGRTLASLGAILTGREKHNSSLVHRLLKAGREYPGRLPVTAELFDESETRKYSPTQAVEWFVEHYPREAGPLVARLEETYKASKRGVIYGLKGKKDMPDELYIGTLSRILEMSVDRATVLYHGIVKPHLDKEDEESRLVRATVKDK